MFKCGFASSSKVALRKEKKVLLLRSWRNVIDICSMQLHADITQSLASFYRYMRRSKLLIQKLSSLSKGRGQKDFEKNSHSVSHMPVGRCCTNTTVQCRLCNVILGASAWPTCLDMCCNNLSKIDALAPIIVQSSIFLQMMIKALSECILLKSHRAVMRQLTHMCLQSAKLTVRKPAEDQNAPERRVKLFSLLLGFAQPHWLHLCLG